MIRSPVLVHRAISRSVFTRSPFSKPFLFVATAAALLIHVGALHFSPTQLVLRIEPIEMAAWGRIVAVAATIVVAIEVHRIVRRDRRAVLTPMSSVGRGRISP